jgi:hypothetical protein
VDSQGGVLPPFMAWLLCGDHRYKDKTEGSARSCWFPRQRTSGADEGGTETASSWTGEENRAAGEREQAGTRQLHFPHEMASRAH